MFFDLNAVNTRRDALFQAVRAALPQYVDAATGAGIDPDFRAPGREPIWVLPALFHGGADDIACANRMMARYRIDDGGDHYNVFQSNLFAALLAEYAPLLEPDARDVAEAHTRMAFRTYEGSAQADLKFHGCNDNMPMMATKALILGGQALDDRRALRQGIWNLNEFRRLLSRAAWADEFNSATYSPITLGNCAKIAAAAHDSGVRELARECEIRLWAELLLHWHPGTRHFAGPSCRAYAIDCAGHTHTLQALFWLVFGAEATGYDVLASYFAPDDREVRHFSGSPMRSVAEFCDTFDTQFHLTEELARLVAERRYPAETRGRAECMSRYAGESGEYHTCCYMKPAYSLGTVNAPLVGGVQTLQFFATYKRRATLETFRDAATVFCRYNGERLPEAGIYDETGNWRGERHIRNSSWQFAMQKADTALLLAVPNPKLLAGTPTGRLALGVYFPVHFGELGESTLTGESAAVEPVSVAAGEVYMCIQPLLPTELPRGAAVRWSRYGEYRVLELINYEGPERTFTEAELARMHNGFVFTIGDRSDYASLADFHAKQTAVRICDYTLSRHRFLRFVRDDVQFEVVMTTDPMGVQTHAIDGRQEPEPVFATDVLDVAALPFMTGPVALDEPFFPWGDSLAMHNYLDDPWRIGSRGLPDEKPYSKIQNNQN